MTFLRHLGKLDRLKVCPCTVRHLKCSRGSVGFLFRVFVLKRSLWMRFLGPFLRAKIELPISYLEIVRCQEHHKNLKFERKQNKKHI